IDTLAATVATTASSGAKHDGDMAALRRELDARDARLAEVLTSLRTAATGGDELRELKEAVGALAAGKPPRGGRPKQRGGGPAGAWTRWRPPSRPRPQVGRAGRASWQPSGSGWTRRGRRPQGQWPRQQQRPILRWRAAWTKSRRPPRAPRRASTCSPPSSRRS